MNKNMIEKQVCSLAQARRLKDLGVVQQSVFHHFPNNNVVLGDFMDLGMLAYPSGRSVSAFTVGELGQALKVGDMPRWVKKIYFGNAEEAKERADFLIYLLENKLTELEGVNKRLLEWT